MNRTRRLTVAALALTLVGGGASAVSTASAEAPRTTARTQQAPQATLAAWAKINASGLIFGRENIGAVQRVGFGRYILNSNIDLGGCALIGTLNGNNDGDPGPGSSSIMVNRANARQLFVRTSTPSMNSVDDNRAFSVLVIC